jgi:hypothetical protein
LRWIDLPDDDDGAQTGTNPKNKNMKQILCIYCGNPVEPSENREVGKDYHEDCLDEIQEDTTSMEEKLEKI